MGLIRAAVGAVGGTMADQWREFFYCEAMDADTLVVKGQKQVGRRSSNTKGSENIISNGSGIAVADGQCMMIVEQGKIVEVCAEPGEFTYDSSTEPSIFTGKLGEGLKKTFATFGKRFTYGGDTGKDQRVYYINTKEIMDNKFGTANPFLFHVVDHNTGLSRDVQVRCNGIYSYRITDPILFYKNVCGNVEMTYDREEIDGQLKTEFISALQPAFAQLSKLELLPSDIPAHAGDLEEAMTDKDILVLAVPSPFTRSTAYSMRAFCKEGQKIVDVAKRSGATVSGPVPLPTEKEIEGIGGNVDQLIAYLKNSHSYYLENRMFSIQEQLKEISEGCEQQHQQILNLFFNEYKNEVIRHFDYEEVTVFPYISNMVKGARPGDYEIGVFRENHSNIDDKLNDLKNIIMKYLPGDTLSDMRIRVLFGIFALEEDLSKHSLIEDKILIPLVMKLEQRYAKQ